MIHLLVLIGSLVYYSASKYFPFKENIFIKIIQKNLLATRFLSLLFLGVSQTLYVLKYDFLTGISYSIIIFTAFTSLIVFAFPVLNYFISNQKK